jgi:peptidoglycan/LPS O-acetylase OafA/YrhL
MFKPERVVLAILGSSSVLTALVLVFLVLVAVALVSLQAGAPAQAERPFRVAGAASFAAFLAGVACLALSVWYLIQQHHTTYVVVVVAFVLQLALLTLAAGQVFIQVIYKRRLQRQSESRSSVQSRR